MGKVSFYRNGRLEPGGAEVVREFPLKIVVNHREIATLVCSPHDLNFLVAGFLRMQGFVRSVEDFLVLSVCGDFGVASVEIRGEVPQTLRPVLTSGCGAGIGFTVNGPARDPSKPCGTPPKTHRPSEIFGMMERLARLAESYRSHGGIHSAAAGDGDAILLYAEDVGRHNTVDRIAGEALFKGIDLDGTMLVTSGRVSTELAAKAAMLGISVIASRTAPTDMAVKMCEEAGIVLIGYVRGGRFTIYAHPEHVSVPSGQSRIRGITGVILAGGASRRMGSHKALLPYQGGWLIESVHRCLADLFEEILVVTNTPEVYDFLPCRKVPDLLTGMGVLSGLHSGLCHSANPCVFVVACDMPHLNPELIRHLALQSEGSDVLVPESDTGVEALHAFFHKECLPAIEDALVAGERRIVSFFGKVKVRKVGKEEVARFDPGFRSFRNINTPEDYFRFRGSDNFAKDTEGWDGYSWTETSGERR